jgi:hypothetical protein
VLPWLTIGVAAVLLVQSDARNAFAVGSWIVDAAGEGEAAEHVAMTLSSQGSGVIAFTCRRQHASVLIGLNNNRFRTPVGGSTLVRLQIGGHRAETQASVVSEETVHLDESTTRDLLARTQDGAILSVSLPSVDGDDITLVFRPVESTKALGPLKAACSI